MKLENWINYDILNNLDQLKKEFLEAPFFEHISINNFLIKEKAEELFEELKKEDYYKEENDLYNFLRTFDFKNSKNKLIIDFRNFLLSENCICFIEDLTNSKISRKIIDLHSLKLENTNYLLCHDDLVLGRQFAFIFNLSKDWKEEDGGNLELFESNEKGEVLGRVFNSITPKFNQFNMFRVQKISYHQISEVTSKKSRVSIGGWYHV